MIGDSGTGKSCLLARYTKDQFDVDYKVTIGTYFVKQEQSLLLKSWRSTRTTRLSFKYGIQRANRAFEASLKVSTATQQPSSWSTILLGNRPVMQQIILPFVEELDHLGSRELSQSCHFYINWHSSGPLGRVAFD